MRTSAGATSFFAKLVTTAAPRGAGPAVVLAAGPRGFGRRSRLVAAPTFARLAPMRHFSSAMPAEQEELSGEALRAKKRANFLAGGEGEAMPTPTLDFDDIVMTPSCTKVRLLVIFSERGR